MKTPINTTAKGLFLFVCGYISLSPQLPLSFSLCGDLSLISIRLCLCLFAAAAVAAITNLHDVDRVEVGVAEGQLPAQELVSLDQLLVLRNLEDLACRFPQPPVSLSLRQRRS